MLLRFETINDPVLKAKFKAFPPCDKPHLLDGKPYKLVPKTDPKCNKKKLADHETETVVLKMPDGTSAGQVMAVKIPLGLHGKDHMAYDTAKDAVVCLHCQPAK